MGENALKIGLILAISCLIIISGSSSGVGKQINSTQQISSNTTVYTKPSSYSQLVSWYTDLESSYPDYLEVFKANELYGTGKTTGGYDQYYVRITNENLGLHKPEVLFCGSPHGDETVGTIGLYWFTDWLMRMAFTEEPCQEYSKEWLRWLIDNREIYFEVSHNPYGFDHGPQRHDGNGWDLNREADYDGPGSPTGGIWASVPGKTLRKFVDNHLIRSACDFHGGVRMLLYPWADTHSNVDGTSPITGKTYGHAPPDFYFYDVQGLRLGSYMGDYGGDLNKNNIGTIHELIWYSVKGGIAPWAYAADVIKNPVEDQYVDDEIHGNYPGAGIIWFSPEMSTIKNPSQSTFGSDTDHKYGAEVRRFVLHQTDLAQPYLRWQPGTIEDHIVIEPGTPLEFKWQVNGSLVVDHTYIQWGTDPDPRNNYDYTTNDHDTHEGDYLGGTGWDDAESGQTFGETYSETITIDTAGEYYFVSTAQVDQIYGNVLRPDVYGDTPYSRLIKERTSTYHESLQGTDGTEEINGQLWWYSQILHVTVNPGEPILSYSPKSHDFGDMYRNQIADTSIQIQNIGDEILNYELTPEHDWIKVTPTSGDSSGETDTINLEIDTTSLQLGFNICNISITSNGGDGIFTVSVNIKEKTGIEIKNPEKGYIYFHDKKSFKRALDDRPLIFGAITIDADVSGSDVEYVEFFVNDKSLGNSSEEPYNLKLNERIFWLNKIKVIAYNSEDVEVARDEMEILIYNFGLRK